SLFAKIFKHTGPLSSLIEYGANIGLNLLAIKQLQPECALSAVEINATAANRLRLISGVAVYEQSIHDFHHDKPWDLSLTKGVLIHLDPDKLPDVYDLLYRSSERFICLAEYYNPTPVEVPYRQHT